MKIINLLLEGDGALAGTGLGLSLFLSSTVLRLLALVCLFPLDLLDLLVDQRLLCLLLLCLLLLLCIHL